MKLLTPYNILLTLTVTLTCLMVWYNFLLRDSFSVIVSYNMPAIPQSEAEVVEIILSDDKPEEEEEEPEDYGRDVYNEESAIISVTFPLDINRATEAELRFIPKVGEVMARRIVQYRDVLGKYENLEQLMEIKGVGEATFERIAAYLIIEDAKPAEPEPAEARDEEEEDE